MFYRLVLLTAFLFCEPAYARRTFLSTAISPSLTAGVGGFRAGATFDIAKLTCQDACGGFGVVAGVTDFYRREYTLGVGMIGMYMASILLQGEVRIKDGHASGFHITPGFGIFSTFVILRLGYDQIENSAVAELGVTAKIPLTGW